MKAKLPTQTLIDVANALCMARAQAEVLAAEKDKIARNILSTAGYRYDEKQTGRRDLTGFIREPKDTFLMSDEDHRDYLLDLKAEMIKAGLKPVDIPGEPPHSYYCPALTAETTVTELQWALVDLMAEHLGKSGDLRHDLLCAGLDKYNEFIELSMKHIINAPNYKQVKMEG